MKSAVEGLESRSDRKCIECGEGEMGVEANGRWSGGGEVIGAFCFSSGDLKPEPAKGFFLYKGSGLGDLRIFLKCPQVLTIFLI